MLPWFSNVLINYDGFSDYIPITIHVDVHQEEDSQEDLETCDKILQEQGVRARALYDYQAGKITILFP